ncbi:MAG: hypothetical protein SXU28_07265 [Pseudomonadota bacterium]|nr:hypothetical protein [Pseudomonadota bacterium]
MKNLSASALTLGFLSPLMLIACGEAPQTDQQEPAAVEQTEAGDTAGASYPEGQTGPDGEGGSEAYGERGDEGGPKTEIPEDGQVKNVDDLEES